MDTAEIGSAYDMVRKARDWHETRPMRPTEKTTGMTVAPVGQIEAARLDARDGTLEGPLSQAEHQAAPFIQTDMQRPRVRGKFLFVGDEKFWIRGVTYGTFKHDHSGV